MIETALIMVILGFIIAAIIKMIPVMIAQEEERRQEKNYDTVRAALSAFLSQDADGNPATPELLARYPCPAPLNVGPNHIIFGTEQRNADGTCAGSADGSNGIFEIEDGSGNTIAYIGAIPTRTLKISSEYMLAPFKHKLTYAVSANMVQDNAINLGLAGQLRIMDESDVVFNDQAHFALISHGKDGSGAYSMEGGKVMDCVTALNDGENCDYTEGAGDAVFRESQVKLGNNNDFYDDRLAFSLVDDEDDEWWESVDGVDHIRNKNAGVVCIGDSCDPTIASSNDVLIADGSIRSTSSMNADGHLSVGGNATITDDAFIGRDAFAGRDITAVRDVLAGQDVSATNNVLAGNLLSGAQGGVIGTFDANTLNGNSFGVQHDITAGRDIFGRDLHASRGLRVGENPSDNGSMGIDGDSWFRGALNIDSDKDGSWGSIYNGGSTEGLVLSGKWHDWQGTPREDLVIHENGRVGIGTSTPTTTLDVNGKVRVRGGLDIDSDTDGSWGSLYNSSVSEGLVISGKHTGIAREDIVIRENGKVGISVSDPKAQLDVNGNIRLGDEGVGCNENRGSVRWQQISSDAHLT